MNFLEIHQKKTIQALPTISPENPMVSVCIQTYQHGPYIQQCLDSILAQVAPFPFEILVGEDGSKDGTREFCKDYAAKYPEKLRVFLHERENNIPIDGRPTGRFNFLYNLHQARGKYIAFCEGDDYWTDPLKLQKQVAFLEEHPDYVLCFHSIDIDPPSLEKGEYQYSDPISFDFYQSCQKSQGPTVSLMFRNNLVSPDEFYQASKQILACDWPLECMVMQGGKGYVLTDRMAAYRKHAGGMSNQFTHLSYLKGRASFFEEITLTTTVDKKPFLRRILAKVYIQMAAYYFYNRGYRDFLRFTAKGIRGYFQSVHTRRYPWIRRYSNTYTWGFYFKNLIRGIQKNLFSSSLFSSTSQPKHS